ncbi:MAG: sulfoxide reductase heme-binding subunit YedZ [Anaerolineales bacterium]|jgi:sulfoxide reductase heme-binding subunit YedZ
MTRLRRIGIQLVTHAAALTPMGLLIFDWYRNDLTANPIQAATLRTGKTALVLLTITLAITPLNTLFGFKQLIPVRKWFGLYAACYVAVHFFIFIGIDYSFDFGSLKDALFNKRFALVGLASGLLLIPLVITSTRSWQRRLGKNWKRLHRFVYLGAFLATVHYTWLVKSDIRVPLVYMTVVVLLLVLRIPQIRTAGSRFHQMLSRFGVHLRARWSEQVRTNVSETSE